MKKVLWLIVCLMTMVISLSSCSTDGCKNDYLAYSDVGYTTDAYSSSKQCAVTTKNGTRCKRKAESGSIYCWQHKK